MNKQAKVVPLKAHFENMQAMLAHIAEDKSAIGFVGCVIWSDESGARNMREVCFRATVAETAYASVVLARSALE